MDIIVINCTVPTKKIAKDITKPVVEMVGASVLAAGVMHSIQQGKQNKIPAQNINSDYLDPKVKNIERFDADLILKTFDYPVMFGNPELNAHLNSLLETNAPEAILFVNYLFASEEFNPTNLKEMGQKTSHKKEMVQILSDENNRDIVKTIFSNFAKINLDEEQITPRFNSEEICELIDLYNKTEENERRSSL